MTDKELLDKLFEFETYCTARFDSEVRVAMAVYEYVKQMKQDTRHEITNRDVRTYPDARTTHDRATPDNKNTDND